MTDPRVLQSDALTRELRQWLRARAAFYGDEVIGSTLMYELSAILALHAETLSDVDEAIDRMATTMKEQARAFGIGIEHP